MTRPKPPGTEGHGAPRLTGPKAAKLARRKAETLRIVPPAHELLQTAEAALRDELAAIREKQLTVDDKGKRVPIPGVARDLESIVNAVRKTYDAQRKIEDDLRDDMAGMDEQDIAALAEGKDVDDE